MNCTQARNRARLLFLVALLPVACAIHPAGESEERDRASAALRELDETHDAPPLPEEPGLLDYLRGAFHADADLRARYWTWRAALERIPQEASPPNPALSFSYLFSDEHMTAWDRTTLGLSNDPTAMIQAPSKLATAGRRALEEARAAGLRFEAAKFKLQADVTSLYLDLALHAQQIRAQEETIALLQVAAADVDARVGLNAASATDSLRARNELDLAKNALHSLHSQLPVLGARMNAFLGRGSDAPVPLPHEMPAPRPLPASDNEILELAAQRSPELDALAHEVVGREQGLELARQQWIPDFGLSIGLTGSLSRTLGGMVVLPLRIEAIEGAIEEARANVRAAEAARREYARNLVASFVLDLAVLHDAERQIALFRDTLLPRAEATARSAEAGQATGRSTLAEIVMSRRALIDARLTLAQLEAEREKAIAAIETWSALDVEALHAVRMGPMATG